MKRFLSLMLAVLALCSLASCTPAQGQFLLAAPLYPEMASYPGQGGNYEQAYSAWKAGRQKQLDQPEGSADALDGYLRTIIPQLFSDGQGENRVCAPVNVYMALAMLAEATDGESREQILRLLGCTELDALRKEASAVWNRNYCKDGVLTSILASSLWISDPLRVRQGTVNALAKYEYASTFQGAMGSPALDGTLQDWINQQTGNLLQEQASGLTLSPDTVLALVTTVYFRAEWEAGFPQKSTDFETFRGSSGEVRCAFLHRSMVDRYYWSDQFSAVGLPLLSGGTMWLLLPEDGVTPETLLTQEKALDLILKGGRGTASRSKVIHLAVPKFDIASDLELTEVLSRLGITAPFDPDCADFTPLAEDAEGICLSRFRHAARIAIDEQGVMAAAYTEMPVEATAAKPPEEEVSFTLDRPFVFAVTGLDGLPVFLGIVSQP